MFGNVGSMKQPVASSVSMSVMCVGGKLEKLALI